jgi:hypothetical protein
MAPRCHHASWFSLPMGGRYEGAGVAVVWEPMPER